MRAYFRLVWFFLWRMTVWGAIVGVVVGALFGVLAIGLPLYEGGSLRDLFNLAVLGAILGCVSGAGSGIVCGVALSALTLAFRSLPQRIVRYRIVSAALCAGILIGYTIVQDWWDSDYTFPIGSSALSIINIPLLIAAPFCALIAQWTAKKYSERTSGV